jgi:NADPH2:quinone reductase
MPNLLELREVDKPKPEAGQVMVQVCDGSLNVADYYSPRGGGGDNPVDFYSRMTCGLEGIFSGQVEAIGCGVTQFKPVDEVFGTCPGSFAHLKNF